MPFIKRSLTLFHQGYKVLTCCPHSEYKLWTNFVQDVNNSPSIYVYKSSIFLLLVRGKSWLRVGSIFQHIGEIHKWGADHSLLLDIFMSHPLFMSQVKPNLVQAFTSVNCTCTRSIHSLGCFHQSMSVLSHSSTYCAQLAHMSSTPLDVYISHCFHLPILVVTCQMPQYLILGNSCMLFNYKPLQPSMQWALSRALSLNTAHHNHRLLSQLHTLTITYAHRAPASCALGEYKLWITWVHDANRSPSIYVYKSTLFVPLPEVKSCICVRII